jgi:multiple sugar transport system ATP-binding protein
MDEPLSNLDAKLRVQARAEITKLHQRLETTFIYVTHDQVEAMTMGTRIAVMKDGLLQQVDTPQNLYERPHNVFVGGFIGTPAMNFFDATLTASEQKVFVDTGCFRVELPKERAEFYKQLAGSQIIFGIRPEDIHDPQYAPPGVHTARVDAQVDLTELMGKEVITHLICGDHEFEAVVDPRTDFHVGNQVQVAMNLNNAHIFARDTEIAIR